jgi:hypothetical protein
MQKEFEEKKSIDVKVSRTVCDICGDATKDGDAVIHIQARREEARDPRYVGLTSYTPGSPGLDICSVDCLARNINGITLVLNTKIIPSIPTKDNLTVGFNSPNSIFLGGASSMSVGSALTATTTNTSQWGSPPIQTVYVNS